MPTLALDTEALPPLMDGVDSVPIVPSNVGEFELVNVVERSYVLLTVKFRTLGLIVPVESLEVAVA